MTTGEVPRGGGDAGVAAYEELRSRVLTGVPDPGAALLLLLRQGLAAWLEGRGGCSPRCEPQVTLRSTTHAASPLVSDEIQAGIVGVLASMVLAA